MNMIYDNQQYRIRKAVFSFFFCFAERGGRSLPGKILVEFLSDLGFDEGQSRLCIGRMRTAGILVSQRKQRETAYVLTERGAEHLIDGEAAYYAARGLPFPGLWTMVVYRVPESRRKLRDEFRAYLEFAAFAQFAPSVWVRPEPRTPALDRELERVGTTEGAEVTAYELRFEGNQRELAGRLWDLDPSRRVWEGFNATWKAFADSPWSGEDREAFRLGFSLDLDWVAARSGDPRLPAPLLPEDWPGFLAAEIREGAWSAWGVPAWRHAASVFEKHGLPRPRNYWELDKELP